MTDITQLTRIQLRNKMNITKLCKDYGNQFLGGLVENTASYSPPPGNMKLLGLLVYFWVLQHPAKFPPLVITTRTNVIIRFSKEKGNNARQHS
jgi:hypothetical protein